MEGTKSKSASRRKPVNILNQAGWLISVNDLDGHNVAMSEPMTLGDAVALMDRFNDGGAGCFSLIRPRQKGGK